MPSVMARRSQAQFCGRIGHIVVDSCMGINEVLYIGRPLKAVRRGSGRACGGL
jgi:hypothetical protein